MRIPFRQGIVSYHHPQFVQVDFMYVNLIASNESPLILNIASDTTDYLHSEKSNITHAWGPITVGSDVWLYVDIDRHTAQRTFGTTYSEPTVGATAPLAPSNNKHWFDTTINQMKVWNGTNWAIKIRIFACKLQNGTIPISMSILSPDFSGTQIGNTNSVLAGYILFDTNQNPLKSVEGQFTTSEDVLRVSSASASDVKVASLVVEAMAQVNFPAYTIVEFTNFGIVKPATAFVTQSKKQYGIVQTNATTGDIVNVNVDGLITNSTWDWTSVGVNTYLYNDDNGFISATSTIPDQQPVGIVVDIHTIMLVTKIILTNAPVFIATDTIAGISKLSVISDFPNNPVVVGDNDLRLTNARHPLPHSHPISDTTNLQSTLDAKLNLAGGIMTGTLILHSNPSGNLDAATKQYVDAAITGLFWQTPINDPDLKNDILNTPPVTPGLETYIVGGTPTGLWIGLAGHFVRWNGSVWIDILNRPVAIGDRFGVGLELAGVPSGGLTGQKDKIAQVTANTPGSITYDFTTPTKGFATLVDAQLSSHFGHQYTYNGTEWVELSGEQALDTLTDVLITSPIAGQALTYSGVNWINATPTTTLVGLSDVLLSTPTTGQALTYNGTHWINSTPATSLSGLNDVTLSTPVSGQLLSYNGTKWINSPNVNSNVGSFGTNSQVGTFTVNGQGLVTIASNTPISINAIVPTQTGNAAKFLKTDGTIVSWDAITTPPVYGMLTAGGNAGGTLGDGTQINKSSPIQVGSLTDWSTTDGTLGGTYSDVMSIKTNGSLWGWGANPYGELGNGVAGVAILSPIQIGSAIDWNQLSKGGYYHVAIIKTGGTLWACGYNGQGQLGLGDINHRSSLTQVGLDTNWRQVECGVYTTIAIKNDGTLWNWGFNSYNTLGDGTTIGKSSPIQIGSFTTWSQISGGGGHNAAIDINGKLYIWGWNLYGQLGDGTQNNQSVPTQVGSLTDWKQVCCTYTHSAALKTDGTIWTWGDNTSGKLGLGDTIPRSSPVQVGSATTWKQIVCGYGNTCAIRNDGTLWAWGSNANGELGDGTTIDKSSPIQIGSLTGWQQAQYGMSFLRAIGQVIVPTDIPHGGTGQGSAIAAFNALAPVQTGNIGKYLTTDGANASWGVISTIPSQTNNAGKYLSTNGTTTLWSTVATGGGGGTPPTAGTPNRILSTLDGFTKKWIPYTVPITYYTMWTWGYNLRGQLGDGTITNRFSPIQLLSGSVNWTTISNGYHFSTSVKADGTLWTWGYNDSGQLGQGNITPKSSPVQVGALTNWASTTAGIDFMAAIKTDGTLWTWGSNTSGKLGDGTTIRKSSPIQVGALTNWNSVCLGTNFITTIKNDGTLWTWGNNSNGQLGDGTVTSTSSPSQIGTLTNWTQASNGDRNAAAVKSDGTLWTWGFNGSGQLGLGDIASRSSPTQVGALTNWKQIACGYTHNVAVKTDGTLWGWGWNSLGQLGLGDRTNRSSPVQIGSMTNWASVSCGYQHTTAIKTDGTLWSWGSNTYGQIGDSTSVAKSSPVQIGSMTNWSILSDGFYHTIALQKTDSVGVTTPTPNTVAGRDSNADLYANNFISNSDIILKEHIRDIETPEDLINTLIGHRFRMIDSQQESFGLIAQEVELILPELVFQNGDTKSVNYIPIIGILIEAVKSLKHKIDILSNK